VLHQLGPHDPLREAGVVVDLGGDHQLAAGAEALDHEGREVGASGVQRGRVCGRATTDDQQVMDFVGHRASPR
jgi:hypothetical protein